ncbi:caveolin-2 [Gouania willdenowi]|uniref:Caveolin n=1 Tax=Gouania willdenowi TaxID=441366 RepID=A0A8C5ET80_GOUWI|nr:caveolin-2 [Gouania willdenowi]
MGLEMEKADMDTSIEPILSQNNYVFSEELDRDPNDINAHLKVGFEDVIAEPASTHSFDQVWIGSHALFELVKFIFYRLLTVLLAVPMAFILGLVLGVLSCIHIWLVMPFIQSFMMLLPSIKVVWRSLTDMFITPLYYSMGRSLSSVQVKATEE